MNYKNIMVKLVHWCHRISCNYFIC